MLIKYQAFRFLSVGIVNTFVGLGVIFIAKAVFNLGDVFANAMGYSIGLLVSYTLNSKWTFHYNGEFTRTFVVFLFCQLIAYFVNLVCVIGLIKYGIDSYVAQAMGLPPYVVISYIGMRYFAFSQKS